MKRLIWMFVIWGILGVAVLASPPKAFVADLAGTSFARKTTSVQELPRPLRLALAKTFVQKTLDLGNPNQRIGAEILTANTPHSPDRRLIFAFETPKYYVVYVEYGPPAVHASALVFDKTQPKSLELVWGGVDLRMPPFATNPSELAKRILAGKLRDDRGFIW